MATLKQKAEQILTEKNKLTPDILKANKTIFNVTGNLVSNVPNKMKFYKTKLELFESTGENWGDIGVIYKKYGYNSREIKLDEYVHEFYIPDEFSLTDDEFNYLNNEYEKMFNINTAGWDMHGNSYIQLVENNGNYYINLKLMVETPNEQGEYVREIAKYDLKNINTHTFKLNKAESNIETVSANRYAAIWLEEYGIDADIQNSIIKKMLKTRDWDSISEDSELWVQEEIDGIYQWSDPNWYIYGNWEAEYSNIINITDYLTVTISANSQDRYETQNIKYDFMYLVDYDDIDEGNYSGLKLTGGIFTEPYYICSGNSGVSGTVSDMTLAEFEASFKDLVIEFEEVERNTYTYKTSTEGLSLVLTIDTLKNLDGDTTQHNIYILSKVEIEGTIDSTGIYVKTDEYLDYMVETSSGGLINSIQSATYNDFMNDLETIEVTPILPYHVTLDLDMGVSVDIYAQDNIVESFKSFNLTFNATDTSVSISFDIIFPEASEPFTYSTIIGKNSSSNIDVWGATQTQLLSALDNINIVEVEEIEEEETIDSDIEGYSLDVSYEYLDEAEYTYQMIKLTFTNNTDKPLAIDVNYDDEIYLSSNNIFMGDNITHSYYTTLSHLRGYLSNNIHVTVNENAPYNRNFSITSEDEHNINVNIYISADSYLEDLQQDVTVSLYENQGDSSIYVTPLNMDAIRIELQGNALELTYNNVTPSEIYNVFNQATISLAQGFYGEVYATEGNSFKGLIHAKDSADREVEQEIDVTLGYSVIDGYSPAIEFTLNNQTYKMLPCLDTITVTFDNITLQQVFDEISFLGITELTAPDYCNETYIGPNNEVYCKVYFLEDSSLAQKCAIIFPATLSYECSLNSPELDLNDDSVGFETIFRVVDNKTVAEVMDMLSNVTVTVIE